MLTYSWDRLLVDPLPGPRTAADFTGLRQLATDVHEVTTTTAARTPAGSSLPRLARELPARLLLLDPAGGAAAMAGQVRAAAAFFDCSQVLVLDVGGDILTDGHDPLLRSPLADQLALAACLRADLATRVLIAAAGLDGEVDPTPSPVGCRTSTPTTSAPSTPTWSNHGGPSSGGTRRKPPGCSPPRPSADEAESRCETPETRWS